MLQEYLQRTFFVCVHGALLLLYLFLLVRAHLQLRRERATLRHLTGEWDEDQDTWNAGQLDPEHLRNAVAQAPRTMLSRQLRAILRTSPTAENFDPQRILAQLGRSLAGTDDLIRFCINGLVIVGLVGTLYAFYHMWGTRGTAELTNGNSVMSSGVNKPSPVSRGPAELANGNSVMSSGVNKPSPVSRGPADLTNGNSVVYLENMSTALLVSLVGLMLALITNFFFALLRGRRQVFLKEVAAFLTPIVGLVPTDAKTHLLITQLLAPLNELVVQLGVQNDKVLSGLTEAVNTRTEQLNQVIDKAVVDWQSVIGAFRAETLTAVTSLTGATDRLSVSSANISNTLSDVSQALERTKDIGRIVDQLEASSGQVITTISQRLSSATEEWIAIHNLATQAHQSALEEQSKMVASATRGMTGIIRADLSQMVAHALAEFDKLKEHLDQSLVNVNEQLAVTLEGFSTKFAASQETISAKWMTEATAVTDRTKSNMEGIVDGWLKSLTGAEQNINTAFAGSRELVKGMSESVEKLSKDIQDLTLLAQRLSETSGAPVYLAQTVECLGQMTDALEALSAKLEYGQALHQLRGAVEASENAMLKVGRQVMELGVSQNKVMELGISQNKELITLKEGNLLLDTKLDRFGGRFKDLDIKLADVHSEIGQLSRKRSGAAPPPIPPTDWQRLRHRFGRMFRRKNVPTSSSDGSSPPDEDTSTREKSHNG